MRKYCVLLITIIMLMPSGEIRASEATMVASLSITERPVAETHQTIVVLSENTDAEQLHVVWGIPDITVTVRAQDGGFFEQTAVADMPIDFSKIEYVQEVSVY